MAARNRIGLSENTRKRIQASMLVDRLYKHALGEVEMSATQIQAARILLAKVLPDLRMMELGGVEDSPLKISIIKHADNRDSA